MSESFLFLPDKGIISLKSYKSLYSCIFFNITSLDTLSILFKTSITGLSISSTAVQATIEVPNNAYVAIYLSDPSGSASNLGNMALYSWEEDNYQYVSPGNTRASVTYTINTYQIH